MVISQLIQSQLFHLISMLICIGVVVWLLVRHYTHNAPGSIDNRIRFLNTIYISGILLFIVIELITAICMENTRHADIMSFVSFAATLSSLILSIVAIIFTIVYSNRGASQYQKLDKVSDDVKESLIKFTEKTQSLDGTIARFNSVAEDLSGHINDIYDKLSGMEVPIKEMRDQMLASDGVSKDSKTKDGKAEDTFQARVNTFISQGSFSGNLALYACVLSKEKNRQFSMSQIRENDDDEAYKFGYIIAASAMGIVNASVIGIRIIQVKDYYPELKELLEKALNAFIDNSDIDTVKQSNIARLNSIKKVFE